MTCVTASNRSRWTICGALGPLVVRTPLVQREVRASLVWHRTRRPTPIWVASGEGPPRQTANISLKSSLVGAYSALVKRPQWLHTKLFCRPISICESPEHGVLVHLCLLQIEEWHNLIALVFVGHPSTPSSSWGQPRISKSLSQPGDPNQLIAATDRASIKIKECPLPWTLCLRFALDQHQGRYIHLDQR